MVAISAVSNGLDHAQKETLDPLAGIGTDLTVTRAAHMNNNSGLGGGGDFRDLIAANSSVITDLSKLGKPGRHFVHDFFLPGTQLTFPTSQAAQTTKLKGVAAVSTGLVLIAEHQEGTVPKIVAKLKAGGPDVQHPAADHAADCGRAAGDPGVHRQAPGPGRRREHGSHRPDRRRRLRAARPGRRRIPRIRPRRVQQCLPARFRNFRTRFTTPTQTRRQVLNPPQTNIKTEPYTIAGVDTSHPGIGLVTPAGHEGPLLLRRRPGARSAELRGQAQPEDRLDALAERQSFRIVGFVQPPLGGQSADVYLPLAALQKLASEKGLANVALVRATSSSAVGGVEQEISSTLQESQVASSKQVADKITGSLVDASNLSSELGLVLSIVAAVAAFLIAALLTLTSVGKRVRELGR